MFVRRAVRRMLSEIAADSGVLAVDEVADRLTRSGASGIARLPRRRLVELLIREGMRARLVLEV